MKVMKIPKYGITVTVDPAGGGNIDSDLERTRCPSCGFGIRSRQFGRLMVNGAVDAIESMILGHACAGIDISSEAYVAGLEIALESIANWIEE